MIDGGKRRRGRHTSLAVELLENRTLLAISVGTNFGALNFPDSFRSVPPDPMAAAGPDHIVEVINTAIGFFDKETGERLFTESLNDFFAPVDAGTDLYDPVVAYDELAGRFYVAVLDTDSIAETSFLLFAVSNTSNPQLGFSEMHKIDVTSMFQGGPITWADFPRTGWNADAYVFSLNMFTFGDESFDHVLILSVDRSTALDLLPATLETARALRDNSHFTMAPATMHESTAGDPMWFVVESDLRNTVRVVRMDDVLADTPTFSNTDIAVAKYKPVRHAKQLGGAKIDAQDTRMLHAAWRDDRLLAAQAVGVKGGTNARWYEFNTATASPTLAQSGNINQGKKVFTYYPSIDIAANGDVAMTFLQSSSKQFMSMYVTGRSVSDVPNVMQTPVAVKQGEATYSAFDDPPYRAGDYSGITVDPVTGTSFWVANEYATANRPDNWGTWIANISVTPDSTVRQSRARLVDAALDDDFDREATRSKRTLLRAREAERAERD